MSLLSSIKDSASFQQERSFEIGRTITWLAVLLLGQLLLSTEQLSSYVLDTTRLCFLLTSLSSGSLGGSWSEISCRPRSDSGMLLLPTPIGQASCAIIRPWLVILAAVYHATIAVCMTDEHLASLR